MIFTVKGEDLKLEGLTGFLKDVGFEEQLNLFGGEDDVISISSDKYFHRGFSYCSFKDLNCCLDVEEDAKTIHEKIENILNLEDEPSPEELNKAIDEYMSNSYFNTEGLYESDEYDKEIFSFDLNSSSFFPTPDALKKGIVTSKTDQELKDLWKHPLQFTFREKGQKFNENKLPMDIVLFRQFPKAIQAIAKCSLNGHNKYRETDQDWLNFKRVEGGSQTYADAAFRHSFDKGSLNDSGLPHIFHKLWNVMAEVELYIEENNIKIE